MIESKKEISTLAVIECKAPDVMVGDNALDQISDYAAKLNAEYVWVTNGIDSIVARYDFEKDRYIDLKELPDYNAMLQRVDATLASFASITDKLNNKDNNLGLLLNDSTLYYNLNRTSSNAADLLEDLKTHPKRYVHFSLFGRKDDSK